MNLFDILGPIMVGPSSSHTAGAARIGYVARELIGNTPKAVTFSLHGSFAATGKGHGTDRALVAGLLGFQPDDERIPNSFAVAKEVGLSVSFETVQLREAHPNTVLVRVTDVDNKTLEVKASSLGGGRIEVVEIDGIETSFTVDYPTLIIRNRDNPGNIAAVTTLLSAQRVNVATMQLYRTNKGGEAVMVLEIDQPISKNTVQTMEEMPDILKVIFLHVGKKETGTPQKGGD